MLTLFIKKKISSTYLLANSESGICSGKPCLYKRAASSSWNPRNCQRKKLLQNLSSESGQSFIKDRKIGYSWILHLNVLTYDDPVKGKAYDSLYPQKHLAHYTMGAHDYMDHERSWYWLGYFKTLENAT